MILFFLLKCFILPRLLLPLLLDKQLFQVFNLLDCSAILFDVSVNDFSLFFDHMMVDYLFLRNFAKEAIDHFFNPHFLSILYGRILPRIDPKLGLDMLDKFLSLVECINEHFYQSIGTISIHFSRYAESLNDLTANLQDLLLILTALTHRKHLLFLFLHLQNIISCP